MKTATFAATVVCAAGAVIAAPVAAPQAGTYGAGQILNDLGIEGTVSQGEPSQAPGIGGLQGVETQTTNINIPGTITGDQFDQLIGKLGGNDGLGKPPILEELEKSTAAGQSTSAPPPADTLSAAPIGGSVPQLPQVPPVPFNGDGAAEGQTGSTSGVSAVANAGGPGNPGSQVSSANDGNGSSALACASSNGEPLSPECQEAQAKAEAAAAAAIEQATKGFSGLGGLGFSNGIGKRQVRAVANSRSGSQQVSASDGKGNSALACSSTNGTPLSPECQKAKAKAEAEVAAAIRNATKGIPGFNLGSLFNGLRKRQVIANANAGPGNPSSQEDFQADGNGNSALGCASTNGQPLSPACQQAMARAEAEVAAAIRNATKGIPGFNLGSLFNGLRKRQVIANANAGPGNPSSQEDFQADGNGNSALGCASTNGQPLSPACQQAMAKAEADIAAAFQRARVDFPPLNFDNIFRPFQV